MSRKETVSRCYLMTMLIYLTFATGVRLSWNVWPSSRIEATRIVVLGWPHLIAPGIRMKRAINVKSTPAPGFSKGRGSVSGKKILGFFGLKENVNFSVHRF